MWNQLLQALLGVKPCPEPNYLKEGTMPLCLPGIHPVVTDGFERKGPRAKRNGKGHYGVDLMYRRPKSGAFDKPVYTRHFYCPSNVLAVACSAGTVVRVVTDGNGTAVYLSHGRYMSVYRHLKDVEVSLGETLLEGDFLGLVSHAPKAGRQGVNHLHFEIWDTDKRLKGGRWNRARQAIDPEHFLRGWTR